MKKIFDFIRFLLVMPFTLIWMFCALLIHWIYPEFSRTLWEKTILKIFDEKDQ